MAAESRWASCEHARAEVDADDFLCPEIPEGQRVPAPGALEMDRPPATTVEVTDQLDFGTEEVDAARSDEGDGLVEPAFVALGGLVPRKPVGRVHRSWVGKLRRGGEADVRVFGHPRSLRHAAADASRSSTITGITRFVFFR